MSKIRLLFSAVFSVAALSMPVMAHAQRVETVCNDGSVFRTTDVNACRHHRGVRSTTNDNRRVDRGRMDNGRMNNGRMDNGRMNNGRMNNGRMDNGGMTSPRGEVGGRGGMTTAQMMAELHIDHTRNNATAKCEDGFYYHGYHDRSACSHDGGVSNWYK